MNFCARILYIVGCVLSLWAVDAMGTDLATEARMRETVRGYLVDAVCVKEEAAQLTELGPKHTKKCLQMPACRESGYALLSPSKHGVVRFDKRGNDLAVQLVNLHPRESGWLLLATGKRTGDQFAVATLEFVPKSPVKRRKQ
jgi:hypothetical protein